jgi:hypothetical protein
MKNVLTLTLLLIAAACSAESSKQPAPVAMPSEKPAAAAGAMKLVKTTPSASYPLKKCVVSGEELGSMGDPVAYKWGDVEVQFCCDDCVAKFEKEPEKYAAMVRAAGK